MYSKEGKWVLGYDLVCSPAIGGDPHKIEAASKEYYVAKNNINGVFFYQRREMISRFCRRMASMNMQLGMYNLDAQFLDEIVPTYPFFPRARFDRIDVSNVADVGWLELGLTIKAMVPCSKATTKTAMLH
jgi:hypothetical protein